MAFPAGWPPKIPSGIYSLRFYKTGTATANFSDNAFIFSHPDGTGKEAFSQCFRIVATSSALEFSFDGINVHGKVPASNEFFYFDRHEGGICIRGGGTYEIEAW